MIMLSVLIADSDLDMCEALRLTLEEKNYSVSVANDAFRCLDHMRVKMFDLILLELQIPNGKSLEIIDHIRKTNPSATILALTRASDVELAVKAVKMGVREVYLKPIDLNRFMLDLEKIKREIEIVTSLDKSRLEKTYSFDKLASQNIMMQRILDEIQRFAQTDVNILLTGESGTGKGLIARTIHHNSTRSGKDFIEINCSAIPSTLLESELFGYEKGAFTDARETRRGLFELADNSTLFLDEISTMDFNMQSKLLKVIEDFKFYRVGGRKEIKVNTRIITATNSVLKKLVDEKKFREDLYYRLNVASVHLPPLRERREDILDIFLKFVDEFNHILNKSVDRIAPDVATALKNYDWPGNIRELRNVCERVMVILKGDVIDKTLLPAEILAGSRQVYPGAGGLKTLDEIVREHILITLDALKGNKSKAAKVLGISRTTLISKINGYKQN
jgi:two-component system response regulator AtoC